LGSAGSDASQEQVKTEEEAHSLLQSRCGREGVLLKKAVMTHQITIHIITPPTMVSWRESEA